MTRRLKLVPWEPTWMAHQTLDLKAIYRRPRRTRVEGDDRWHRQRDRHGFVLWDLTPPMTIRNHYAYQAKGFEYVTLADVESVVLAGDQAIALKGATPLGMGGRAGLYPNERADDYIRQGQIRGPWNLDVYRMDLEDEMSGKAARVEANVARMGPDAAEMFERQTDPDYVLPDWLRERAAAPRKRGRPRKTPIAEPVEEATPAA